MKIYTSGVISKYLAIVEENGHEIYFIPGSLVDNWIVLPTDKYKGAIIKECYLNPWSSGQTVRKYNKLPAKYQKVIDLLESGETEKAYKLFNN